MYLVVTVAVELEHLGYEQMSLGPWPWLWSWDRFKVFEEDQYFKRRMTISPIFLLGHLQRSHMVKNGKHQRIVWQFVLGQSQMVTKDLKLPILMFNILKFIKPQPVVHKNVEFEWAHTWIYHWLGCNQLIIGKMYWFTSLSLSLGSNRRSPVHLPDSEFSSLFHLLHLIFEIIYLWLWL